MWRSNVPPPSRAHATQPLRKDRAGSRLPRLWAFALAAFASLALIVPCMTMGAGAPPASERYEVTPISGTYMGAANGPATASTLA